MVPPSFRNLPVSPSIPAAYDRFTLFNNLKIISSSTQMNEEIIFQSLIFIVPVLNLNCIYVLDKAVFQII